MTGIFIKILNMSLTSLPIIFCVILVRAFLKKAPKVIPCVLWALVAVSLVCPFRFESRISAVPEREPVKESVILSSSPKVESGIPVIDSTVNSVIDERFEPELAEDEKDQKTPLEKVTQIASLVWCGGIVAMLIYCAVSYLRIHKKVRASLRTEGNVYSCDYISTPFILGVIRPKIYLPSELPPESVQYVIAHERAHIKRLDHIWKPLGFLLLSVYWFNPFVWIGYILLCRDIELACDEKVAKGLDIQQMKSYSEALLLCSVPRRMIAACPVAFGEVGVKARIKALVNYKKPAFWIIIISVLICIAVGVVFLTVRPDKSNFESNELSVIDSSSDCRGVSARIVAVDLLAEDPYFEIEWKNNTLKEYSVIDGPGIYKKTEEKWELSGTTDSQDNTITGISKFDSFTKKYSLKEANLWPKEKYRVEFTLLEDDSKREGRVWIEFEVYERAFRESFDAVVIDKIYDWDESGKNTGYLIVRPLKSERERKTSDKIIIYLETVHSGTVSEFIEKGSTVRIVYDGRIEETYPAKLPTVYRIEQIFVSSDYAGNEYVKIEGTGYNENGDTFFTHYGNLQIGTIYDLNGYMEFSVLETAVLESMNYEDAYGETGDTDVYYPDDGHIFIGAKLFVKNLDKAHQVTTSASIVYNEKRYYEQSTVRDYMRHSIVEPQEEREFWIIVSVPSEVKNEDGIGISMYFSSSNYSFTLPVSFEETGTISLDELSRYTGISFPKETTIDYFDYIDHISNDNFLMPETMDIAVSVPIEYADKVLSDILSVAQYELEKEANVKGALCPDAKDKAPLKYEDVENIYFIATCFDDDEATQDIDERYHVILGWIYTCKKEKELLLYMFLDEEINRAYDVMVYGY
ncbi:MAG: hypothetical protein IJA52_02100 [Clostridia bacterium]|nr:hypothetical protein [Clostridia bacterium]